MKKFLLYLSFFVMTLMAGAQEPTLKARSVYDVNQDDQVTVQDVPALANRLLGKAADKTVVDTQSLLSVLNNLADQYANLLSQYEKILSELADLKAKVNSCTCSCGSAADSHEYVEIGGKKWATMNLGATTVAGSYATCAGDFYAWGETTPRYTGISWSGSEASFNWKSGFSSGYSTYPSYTGTTLDAAHDAVASHPDWGDGWRTPTNDDFKALYAACGDTGSSISSTLPSGSKLTTARGIYWCSNYDGVAGLLFCDGTNKLFFPAAGGVYATSHYAGGSDGDYWSSSLHTSSTSGAYGLDFTSSNVYPSNGLYRYNGYTIRPLSD